MLAILSAFDDAEFVSGKEKISFIHLTANSEDSMRIEGAPLALALARKFNLKKVYILYGEKGKIIYEYDDTIQS